MPRPRHPVPAGGPPQESAPNLIQGELSRPASLVSVLDDPCADARRLNPKGEALKFGVAVERVATDGLQRVNESLSELGQNPASTSDSPEVPSCGWGHTGDTTGEKRQQSPALSCLLLKWLKCCIFQVPSHWSTFGKTVEEYVNFQWHCRGRRFDPVWLHQFKDKGSARKGWPLRLS